MHDYRTQTRIERDRSLTIRELPFQAGDHVEIIGRSQEGGNGKGKSHPLRGRLIRQFGGERAPRPLTAATDAPRDW